MPDGAENNLQNGNESNLQMILHNLLGTVENWSIVLVVAGAVIGVALALRSAVKLYGVFGGGQDMYGGGSGQGQVTGYIAGIVLGSLITVFSLVMVVTSQWFLEF